MASLPRLTRRGFLRLAGGAAVAAIPAAAYTWRIEPHWIEVVERDLPIAHLPEPLVGRSLVQISDLHIGPVVEEDYIRHALDRVADLQPDILAITGDFMTCRHGEEIDRTLRTLENLRPARLATVAVLGNHDYGHRWSFEEVADRLSARLADLGVIVLRNETREVRGLRLVGMDDLWGPRFDPGKVMPGLARNSASLVLCHNPDAADRKVWSGYRGWILSGHTHGGQCRTPWGSAPIMPVNNHRYLAGAVDLFDGRWLYINRGLGYLRRFRLNCRPEITVFTLQAGNSEEDARA